jgi:predicted nucleotidyltransferase
MRNEPPALAPIFRSRHQAELLALLFLHPEQEFSLAQAARTVGVSASTLHAEVQRLIEGDLVEVRPVGRNRLLRANAGNRLTASLTQLLLLTYGPQQVVGDEFSGLDGADAVVLFGSWAARYRGEPGPPPHDVDVLVVGDVERAAVYDAADRAERRLGFPVNPVMRTRLRWDEAGDALTQQIKASPTVAVTGADVLGDAA